MPERHRRSLVRASAIALPVLATLLSPVPTAAAASYEAYTTSDGSDGRPGTEQTRQFGCSDKVYAVMEASGLEPGDYQVEVVWRDPTGKEREHTRFPFRARRQSEKLWAWLKLHAPRGAALMQAFEPSYGMDEFIGTWEARFLLNGKRVATITFEVIC